MAELALLEVRIESADAERAAQRLQRSLADVGRSAERIDGPTRTAESSLRRFATGAGSALERVRSTIFSLQGAVVGLGGVLAAREIVGYADAWTNASSRLRLVTGSAFEAARAQEDLFRVAQSSGAQLDATTGLYIRLANATRDLGLGHEGTVGIVQGLSDAFRISGASATEASQAMVQLAQGLAAGALRGDEFNSVAEQAPPIMEALRRETGLTQGQLRDLAAEGGITAELVVRAVQNMSGEWRQMASQMGDTVGVALTRLGNSFARLVGQANETTDATSALAGVINDLADALESADAQRVADEIGSVLGGAAETAGRALTALAANMETVTVAGGAFLGLRLGAALGPWGAALGAVGGALATVALRFDEGTDHGDPFLDLLQDVVDAARTAGSALLAFGEAAEGWAASVRGALESVGARLEEMSAAANRALNEATGGAVPLRPDLRIEGAPEAQLAALNEQWEALRQRIELAQAQLAQMSAAGQEGTAAFGQMQQQADAFLDEMGRVESQIAAVKAGIDDTADAHGRASGAAAGLFGQTEAVAAATDQAAGAAAGLAGATEDVATAAHEANRAVGLIADEAELAEYQAAQLAAQAERISAAFGAAAPLIASTTARLREQTAAMEEARVRATFNAPGGVVAPEIDTSRALGRTALMGAGAGAGDLAGAIEGRRWLDLETATIEPNTEAWQKREAALRRNASSGASAARQAETEARRLREATAQVDLDLAQRQKLHAAMEIGEEAHDRLAEVIEAENAARSAGFDLNTAAGRAYAETTLAVIRQTRATEALVEAREKEKEAAEAVVAAERRLGQEFGVGRRLDTAGRDAGAFDFSDRQRGFWETLTQGPGPQTLQGVSRGVEDGVRLGMERGFATGAPAAETEVSAFMTGVMEDFGASMRGIARDFISDLRQGVITDFGDALRGVMDSAGRAADEIVSTALFNPRMFQQAWAAGGLQRAGMAGAFGMVGGGALASVLGLSNTGGQLGGGLGAAVGSAFGPFGAIAGGLLGGVGGGALGSLINGPRPHPVASASIAFDARGNPFIMGTGNKHMSPAEAAAFGQQGVSAVQGIGAAFGGQLTGRAAFQIGMDDNRARLSTARGVEYFATVEDALSALTRRLIEIPGAIAGMNEGLRQAALNSGLAGDALLQYVSALRQQVDAAHAQIRLWNTGDLTQGEQAVRAIHEQWSAMAPALREVGEGTAALSAAAEAALQRLGGEFRRGLQQELLAFRDPLAAELATLDDWRETVRRDAAAFGNSAQARPEIDAVYYQRRDEIVARHNEAALRAQEQHLRDLERLLQEEVRLEQQRVEAFRRGQEMVRQSLISLETAPDSLLTPLQRLEAANQAFSSAHAAAIAGDVEALADIARLASTLVETARAYDPNMGIGVFRNVTELLRQIGALPVPAANDNTARLVQATGDSAQAVVNALWQSNAQTTAELQALRAELASAMRMLRAQAA